MTPSSPLHTALTTNQILLVCGTGGVGKTTTALVLGCAAAALGRRTLTLTVDPAQRLANALGLDGFDTEIHTIPTAHGHLDAMMLDAKRTFDRVIERHAPNEATAQKILTNPLYGQLSSTIHGSQEYMAMEQLYEVTQSQSYDLIILDTPPTHHALEFFQAPQRMINALSGSMIQLFLKPSLQAGRLGAKFVGKGAATMRRLFGRITGVELLQEMSDLLMSSVALFGGFQERATAVQTMLEHDATGVILVTTPHGADTPETLGFLHELAALPLQLRMIFLNRALPHFALDAPPKKVLTKREAAAHKLYRHLLATGRAQQVRETQLVATLAQRVGKAIPIRTIAERTTEITHVEELTAMAETLLQPADTH
jgi:anion-transporting  ArsA/GET3 family ATPase